MGNCGRSELDRHFAISTGLFSHWQVWLGAAAALQLCAQLLNRYAKRGETAAS
jgi:hypothetical protein